MHRYTCFQVLLLVITTDDGHSLRSPRSRSRQVGSEVTASDGTWLGKNSSGPPPSTSVGADRALEWRCSTVTVDEFVALMVVRGGTVLLLLHERRLSSKVRTFIIPRRCPCLRFIVGLHAILKSMSLSTAMMVGLGKVLMVVLVECVGIWCWSSPSLNVFIGIRIIVLLHICTRT